MKNLFLAAIATLVFAAPFTATAQETSCAAEQYAHLYEYHSNSTVHILENCDTLRYVIQTIPLEKVALAANSECYAVTHPVFGNECVEVTESIDEWGGIRLGSLIRATSQNPALLKKCSFSISMRTLNGKQASDWELVGISYPDELANF